MNQRFPLLAGLLLGLAVLAAGAAVLLRQSSGPRVVSVAVPTAKPTPLRGEARTNSDRPAGGQSDSPRPKGSPIPGGGDLNDAASSKDPGRGGVLSSEASTTTTTTTTGKQGGATTGTLTAGNGAGGTAAGTGAGGASGIPGTSTSGGGSGKSATDTASGDGKDGDGKDENEDPTNAVVSGRVLQGTKPVPAALVALIWVSSGMSVSAASGEDGRYLFNSVRPGDYTIQLLSPPSPAPVRRVSLDPGARLLSEDFIIPDVPPVSGTVVDDETNLGVPNALVYVLTGTRQIGSVRGDGEGKFTLFPLEAGSYNLRVEADGYIQGEASFVVAERRETPAIQVRLTSGGAVAGRVLLPNGSPAAGAYVGLFRLGSVFGDPYAAAGTVVSDAGGNFRLPLPSGGMAEQFRAGAYLEGFAPAYSGATFDPRSAESLQRPATINLSEPINLKGVVVEKAGAPIPLAYVLATEAYPTTRAIIQRFNVPPPSARTDDNGIFSVPALEPGAVRINFSATGYVSLDRSFTIAAPETDAGEVELEAIDEARPGRIFGLIVDEKGAGMAGHNVYIRRIDGGEQYFTTTNSSGAFLQDNIAEGNYRLDISGSTLRRDIWIPLGQTYAGIRPGSGHAIIVFDLGQSARIRVKDAAGSPVSRFRVGVRVQGSPGGGSGSIQNGWTMQYEAEIPTTEGAATIEHLLSGTASFTISIPGGGSREVSGVNIAPGGSVDLGEVTIDGNSRVAGAVLRDEDQTPLAGVLVKAVAPPGAAGNHPFNILTYSARTSHTGEFLLTGLPSGIDGEVELTLEGRVTRRVTIPELMNNETTDLGDLPMIPAGTVQGLVTGPDFTPISGVMIRVDAFTVFTDGSGNYRCDTLAPGTYVIEFTERSGRFSRYSQQVTIPATGALRLDVVMQPTGAGGSQ